MLGIVAAGATAPSPALAWGDHGHRVIADIAWTQMSASTKREVGRLLEVESALATPACPVNATLLVAALSLVLGIYMSTRDDGITLLSTLVNFGALTAFLVLHVSVVVHFLVRERSRDYWRHLAVPVIGFLILAFVVVNAQVAAQTLGFVWLLVGVVVLVVLLVTGRRPVMAAPTDS